MSVVWFHEVGAGDIERVGGKGANLGEMARAGLPVPGGFCVTADAYRRVISEADLWPSIQRLLDAMDPEDASSNEATAAEIRALIERAPVPADVVEAVEAAYAKLEGGPCSVAVRSSATAEDLPEASFAGQQETYLGVRGEAPLLQSIRRCWASLWTGRAVAYRQRNGFPHEQVSLSVVVQRMVEPETAGVLFTVNPVTGRRDEMLINASYGLGESVVSGRVTPDTFRVGRTTPMEVREQVCGTKETLIRSAAEGGTVTEPVASEDRRRLCLDEAALSRLLRLGSDVEAHYGHPQDIEWAFSGGEVFLLQTRPVTSLGVLEARSTAPARKLSGIERRMLDDILEHYPDPPYPLDHEAVVSSYEQLLCAIRRVGVKAPSAGEMILMHEDGLPRIDPIAPRVTLGLFGLPRTLRRWLRVDPAAWSHGEGKRLGDRLAELRKVDVTSLDDRALVQFIVGAVDASAEVGRARFGDYIMPMMVRGVMLKLLVRVGGGGRVEWADLLGDLQYRTVMIDQALERLAERAQAVPVVRATLQEPPGQVLPALRTTEEGRAFVEHLQRFLDEHGARTMKVYLPFSNVSWREDPTPLFATLAAVVRSGLAGAGEARGAAAAERFARLRDGVAARLPGRVRRLFLGMLEKFRLGHVAREATLYLIEELFSVARAGVREAQRRLVAAGALATEDHVRFLTLRELCQALLGEGSPPELRKLATRRRAARAGATTSWRGPALAMASSDADLKGQAGSPGVATGPARVIHGPEEFGKLEPGDVLVCSFTDPAWTPLFSLASAVVADTGGPLSHAAIVAREYGIPAVLGTQVATHRLKDADIVVVDGTRGLVQRSSAGPS